MFGSYFLVSAFLKVHDTAKMRVSASECSGYQTVVDNCKSDSVAIAVLIFGFC